MQKLYQYKIFNILGGASVISLLALGFLIIIPLAYDSADALTISDYTDSAGTTVKVAANPMMSIGLDNTVNFEFTPKTTGEFQSKDAKLTIATNNTDGYKILMTTGTGTLSNGSGGVIKSITGSNISAADFAMNSWGYKLDGDSGYNAIPTLVTEIKNVDTGEVTIDKTNTYNLSFGTKINSSLPAGTYSGEVIISAIANPIKITNMMQLTYMQDMTPEYCENTVGTDGEPVSANRHNEPSLQLTDTRDGKQYWVSKLADQNCWMVQNLDLDIPAEPSAGFISQSDNIPAGWKPSAGTITDNNFSIEQNSTTSYSWDVGAYIQTNPTDYTLCRVPVETSPSGISDDGLNSVWTGGSLDNCNRLEKWNGTQDSHYLLGNYYQWNTATAGSGGENISTSIDVPWNAPSSVCPVGWRLPQSQMNARSLDVKYGDTFYKLFNAYGYQFNETVSSEFWNAGSIYQQQNVYKMGSAPFYFTSGGIINLYTDSMRGVGTSGSYHSGTAAIETIPQRNYIVSADANNVYPSVSDDRTHGRTIRCLAR